jgi:thiamine-phosphate pyrophosphorylase
MKLIVISSPENSSDEIEIVSALFENGLEIFHIHKPNFSKEETKNFIHQIPSKYHNKIFLHSDFPKFHSLEELENYKMKYDYAFLSPIFDSISKVGYKTSHEFHELTRNKLEKIRVISGKNIIALGGIDEDKIETCFELGFAGVAVLGAIWNSASPIEKFKRLKLLCHAEQSEASVLDSSLRSE